MPDYSNLVTTFIEGKVQNRFIIISQALKEFIEKEAPIIESLNVQLSKTWKLPLETVESKQMAESIRIDAESAQNCLNVYNRTFGRIDHQLAMMGSNFSLPRFLAENEVPEEEMTVFQNELRQYWDVTYQPLIDKFWNIKIKLDKLRQILQREVDLLQNMPTVTYYEGFNRSAELRTLFGQERELFWEIVKDTQNITKNTEVVQGLFVAQKRKTKEALTAYLRVMRNNLQAEWQSNQGTMARSILCLAYIAGALNVYLNLKSLAIKQGVTTFTRVLKYFTEGKIIKGENEIFRVGQKATSALKELAPSAIEQLIAVI